MTTAPAQEPEERRAAQRKPLKRRIQIKLADNTVLIGQSVDIAPGGVRVHIDRMLIVPQECEAEFSILIDGQAQEIKCRGRITSCVCTGMSFSIGLQFLKLGDGGKAVIGRYLGG